MKVLCYFDTSLNQAGSYLV